MNPLYRQAVVQGVFLHRPRVHHCGHVGLLAGLFAGIPLALGSWWSLALLIPLFPVLSWRLLDEERVLARDLPGYTEYMGRVKYRLIPKVW